jgi:hypothetical protein
MTFTTMKQRQNLKFQLHVADDRPAARPLTGQCA